ncbi:MAG: glycoside hydrolase family 25 protein [Hydrogenophaga sp.]
MRAFLASERACIDRLLTRCAGLSVGVDEFFAAEFFTTQAGRALILQPQGAFGYFYLPVAVFNDPGRRQAELRTLIDLFTFWATLRERGLILVAPDDPATLNRLHFVGELFDHPQAHPAHLSLNPRGDFSFQPEAIQDADNNVIYKGIRLSGDLYRLVQAQVGGKVFPSCTLVDMAVAWRIASRPTTVQRPVANTHTSSASLPKSTNATRSSNARQPRRSRRRLAGGVAGLALLGLLVWGLDQQHAPQGQPAADRAIGTAPALTPTPAPATTAPRAPAPPIAPNLQATAPPNASGDAPSTADTSHPQGIDLSKWNAQYLDAALASGGLSFVILRATDGTQTDPRFSDLWVRLQQEKLVHGAYHFYRANEPAEAQAQAFLRAYGSPQPLRLPPIVDVEELSFDGLPPNLAVPALQQQLLALLDLLQQATGSVPMIYTNANIGNAFLNHPRFAQYPLWVATGRLTPSPPCPKRGKAPGTASGNGPTGTPCPAARACRSTWTSSMA